MKREDAEEFTQSLVQIIAGSWRQIALAKRLGVPKALGLSVEDWVTQISRTAHENSSPLHSPPH